MARFAHKLFYLRTREREISQARLAHDLGIRQATVSCLEQGLSQPTGPLIVELSKYFDVTPTYLLDDDRGVIPMRTDRWSMRNALVTAGMWVEAPSQALVPLPQGKTLCPLLPGEGFYDDEAKQIREALQGDEVTGVAMRHRRAAKKRQEHALIRSIRTELRAKLRKRAVEAGN